MKIFPCRHPHRYRERDSETGVLMLVCLTCQEAVPALDRDVRERLQGVGTADVVATKAQPAAITDLRSRR